MQPLRLANGALRRAHPGCAHRSRLIAAPLVTHTSSIHSTPHPCARRTSKDVTVNYFEEEVDGPNRKRRRLDPQEVEGEDDADSPPRLDPDLSLGSIMKKMSMNDANLDNAVKNTFTGDEIQRMQNINPFDNLLPYHVSPQDPIPRQSQAYLTQFNQALDMVSMHPKDPARVTDLWRWYQRCKINVPNWTRMIPKDAWDIIWNALGLDSPLNPDKASRLRVVVEDKTAVGWTLTAEEKAARVEGLFLDGKQGLALSEYEQHLEADFGQDGSFLEIGVRMYAVNGQPEKALELLRRIFDMDRNTNPRLLVSVIRSFAVKRDEASLLQAYELYLEMRNWLSGDVNMGDFDIVSTEFLEAGHTEFALAVFRDMMLHGEMGKRGLNAFSGSEAVSRIAEFIGLGSAEQTTKTSLEAIKYLPRRFQNKFFYASWLKKLIGEGQSNAATQVVELMYERGIRPDARHINGIVASLSRSPDSQSKQRAESLGWAMIQQRLDFTHRRRHGILDSPKATGTKPKSVTDTAEDVQIPIQTDRPVPMATIETFSILLQYYARRQQFGYVRHLRDLLVDAEIPMNSFFMNHILYAELRSRGYEYAFARFEVMSKTVAPDLETYLCLWQCMKNLIHDMRNHQRRDFSGFPTHRSLFARMMGWLDGLQGQQLSAALDDMTPEIYHHVLRAFCVAHDLRGTFVALHALRQRFGAVPTQETQRMLLTMIAAVQPISPNKLTKARHRYMRRAKVTRKDAGAQGRDAADAALVLKTVREHRLSRYRARRDEWAGASETPERQAEEEYRLCLEVVWTALRRTEGAAETQGLRVADTARTMGVEEFDAEKAMALVDPA